MSDGAISEDEVISVARLARLSPSSEEVRSYREHLSAVLSHAAELHELDLDGVSPTAHLHASGSPLRADEPAQSLTNDEALSSAPDPISGGFGVPQVLKGAK